MTQSHSQSPPGDLSANSVSVDRPNADLETLIKRGTAQAHAGDYAAALATVASVAEHAEQSVDFNVLKGLCLAATQQFDDAERHFLIATKLDPLNDLAWFMAAHSVNLLAAASPRLGMHARIAVGRNHLRKALQIAPDNPQYLFEFGKVCSWIGPHDEGLEAVERLLRIEPGNAVAHKMFSEFLSIFGRVDEAAQHLGRAAELDPQIAAASSHEIAEVKSITSDQRRKKAWFARYPQATLLMEDFDRGVRTGVLGDLADVEKFIAPTTRFLTLGSCFARHIAQALRGRGYAAELVDVGEVINSTFANRALIDWVLGRLKPELHERICQIISNAYTPAGLRQSLQAADVFIFTMGVAPCFFEGVTGEFILPRPTMLNARALAEKYVFRTTSVSENVDNMSYIIQRLIEINPGLRIIVTVSPVPLHTTFEFKSAVVADCVSKSTLRLAAHEIMQMNLPNVIYWPSFEIVRWLSGHVGRFYGVDDDEVTHVGEETVRYIVDTFVDFFRVQG